MLKQNAKMGLPKCPAGPSSLPPPKARPTRYVRNRDDEYLVVELSGAGVPLGAIAKVLNRPWGVDVKTLKRHYQLELQVGRARCLAAAYERILAAINSPDDPDGLEAALFILDRHGG